MVKIKITLLRIYLNALAFVSDTKAGHIALGIFCRPRKGKLTDENRQTLSSATWETLSLRDIKIQTYRWAGEKATILLAHGWESNAARWQQLAKKLRKQGYNVVALDAPAHGESGSEQFNVYLYAEIIGVVAKHFSPVAIVSHSVGAFSTAFFATHFMTPFPKESGFRTSTVSRLILMAPPSEIAPFFANFFNLLRLSNRVKAGFYKKVEEVFHYPVSYFSIHEHIKSLTIKGLIIHDTADNICPFSGGENIHANWQGSELVATEGYGHRLQNEKVNSLVVDYLKKELA